MSVPSATARALPVAAVLMPRERSEAICDAVCVLVRLRL